MRDMRNVNKLAFENLSDQLKQYENITSQSGKRYISTNDFEKEWLKKSTIIQSIKLLPSVRAGMLEFQDDIYITLIGLSSPQCNLDSDVLEYLDLNAGLVTLLISENLVNLNPTINFLEFDNEIMHQHIDNSYSGHNFIELIPFLEPIQFYKVPSNSLLGKENLNRILLYIYSNNSNNLILKFSDVVLKTISDISLVGSKNISYGLILHSLISTNYKHAFLELYRLIERLFPVNYLRDFHSKVTTNLNFIEFVSELENITSWRPKEDEAIEKIFYLSDDSTKESFKAFFDSSATLQAQTDHKYFYKLRNSIVHFRANHEEFVLSKDQWNLLILATLYLIDQQYTINNSVLSS